MLSCSPVQHFQLGCILSNKTVKLNVQSCSDVMPSEGMQWMCRANDCLLPITWAQFWSLIIKYRKYCNMTQEAGLSRWERYTCTVGCLLTEAKRTNGHSLARMRMKIHGWRMPPAMVTNAINQDNGGKSSNMGIEDMTNLGMLVDDCNLFRMQC